MLGIRKVLIILLTAVMTVNAFSVAAGAEETELSFDNLTVSGFEEGTSYDPATGRVTNSKGEVIAAYTDGIFSIMADGLNLTLSTDGAHNGTVLVRGNSNLTLNNVEITGTDGPAIKVEASNACVITLAEGSDNKLTGGKNSAGLEVGYDYDPSKDEGSRTLLADVTVQGQGSLQATGGHNSAGIGGSYTNRSNVQNTNIASYHGNITINGGNITATGNGGGAGIGSGNNNNHNSDGSTNTSASYKMHYEELGNITINNGTISAESQGSGSGIGGGSHTDTGVITINGGTITKAIGRGGGSGIGNGIGSQQTEKEPMFSKGPGYYFTEIVITGGTIKNAESTWLGAGIGGGYGCDARITISGGTIEKATGGDGNSGANYQGGPGIGAGYMGLPVIEVTGGTINAEGGTGAPGIGYGPASLTLTDELAQQGYNSKTKKYRGPEATIHYDKYADDEDRENGNVAGISISGGNITASGGINAAGIGSGNGTEECIISITGGDILAIGYSDPDDLTAGGAGIGSGTGNDGAASKYKSDTETTVSITGGNVKAIGGWGASGIGSGAANQQAKNITIDADKATIEAYADGTKFAIDTRILGEDGMTTSKETDVTGDILQATFVKKYETSDTDAEGHHKTQNPEGLKSIIVTNDTTGESKTVTGMGDYDLTGYRSFAVTVNGAGNYTVYTDEESIGEGEGRFFSRYDTEDFDPDNQNPETIKYQVENGKLSDNNYLFPVKTIVVEKVIVPEDDMDITEINQTLHFALWIINQEKYLTRADGSLWLAEIEVVDGMPQNTGSFVNIPDDTYGVWEVDENGESILGKTYESYTIASIETQMADGSDDNDATISKDRWNDKIIVRNTYVPAGDQLNYDANGGVGTMDPTEGKWQGTVAVAENEFTREGYTFTGWNTQADGSGDQYSAADSYQLTIAEDVVYAQWEPLAVPPEPDHPSTGDDSHLGLYMAGLLMANITAAAAVWQIRRKESE